MAASLIRSKKGVQFIPGVMIAHISHNIRTTDTSGKAQILATVQCFSRNTLNWSDCCLTSNNVLTQLQTNQTPLWHHLSLMGFMDQHVPFSSVRFGFGALWGPDELLKLFKFLNSTGFFFFFPLDPSYGACGGTHRWDVPVSQWLCLVLYKWTV